MALSPATGLWFSHVKTKDGKNKGCQIMPSNADKHVKAAIAASRFAIGAAPGDIAEALTDPRGWLETQIRTDAAILSDPDLPDTATAAQNTVDYYIERRRMRRQVKQGAEELEEEVRDRARKFRNTFRTEIAARTTHALTTQNGFAERWARFWSNHFTVSGRVNNITALIGPYERDAIRSNCFADFNTLLNAAILHPAMLIYLDNHRSVGPSSRVGERRDLDLNENLARELLELHTLGVKGGYVQQDVEEMAKALTGWTVSARPFVRDNPNGNTIFIDRIREPGTRTVLGKRYGQSGPDQTFAILHDLARHPATAHHIATKLARHFVADEPPATVIEKLERVFLDTDGDLQQLARAVINLDAAWQTSVQKFKSPEELLISAGRIIGGPAVYGSGGARRIFLSLGQMPLMAAGPDGWPDSAEDWAGPDAIKKRLEWANRAARRARDHAAADFMAEALGPLARDETLTAIARAESREQGLTLALMSPEFQRR